MEAYPQMSSEQEMLTSALIGRVFMAPVIELRCLIGQKVPALRVCVLETCIIKCRAWTTPAHFKIWQQRLYQVYS